MTDPTYHFVSGEGWVPENYPSLTWEAQGVDGQYRITLTKRRPNKGERFFSVTPAETLESVKHALLNQKWSSRNNWGGLYDDYEVRGLDAWFPTSEFMVINIDKVA